MRDSHTSTKMTSWMTPSRWSGLNSLPAIAILHQNVRVHTLKEDNCSLTNMIKSFFVQMACIFMVIENMIKSVISLNLLNLKRVVGLATRASVGWECCVIAISLPTNISYALAGNAHMHIVS